MNSPAITQLFKPSHLIVLTCLQYSVSHQVPRSYCVRVLVVSIYNYLQVIVVWVLYQGHSVISFARLVSALCIGGLVFGFCLARSNQGGGAVYPKQDESKVIRWSALWYPVVEKHIIKCIQFV